MAELIDDADARAPELRVHMPRPPLDQVHALLVLTRCVELIGPSSQNLPLYQISSSTHGTALTVAEGAFGHGRDLVLLHGHAGVHHRLFVVCVYVRGVYI